MIPFPPPGPTAGPATGPADPPDAGPNADPAAVYRERRARFAEEEERWARRSFRLSVARFAVFAAGALCLLAILIEAGAPRPAWWIGAALAAVVFVILLIVHDRVIRRERRFQALVEINDEALARGERDWAALPLPAQPPLAGEPAAGAAPSTARGLPRFARDLLRAARDLPPVARTISRAASEPSPHPGDSFRVPSARIPSVQVPSAPSPNGLSLARDLGLFGHASLFHLLGTVHTPPGKTALAAWLLAPASPEEIAARQRAVAELAPEIDLRQELEQRVRPMEKIPPDCEPLLRWAEEEPWLLPHRGLIALSFLSPVITLGLLAAALLTPLPWWPFFLAVTINLVVLHRHGEPIESTFERVAAREREFLLYARALQVIGERTHATERLQRVAAELAAEGQPAHAWMELLSRRLALADVRRTAVFGFLFQTLLLWDLHLVRLLEVWRRDAGHRARIWLSALGDFEALAALAVLAHDNPTWAFPTVHPGSVDAGGETCFEARDLGHPLLPPNVRVGNDVTVGPPGSFLLVTGSNMSGKSTLLRAIGVNAVLAQTGAPVCAAALAMPPLALATSILVEDSLADGVSFFMAELKRVRQVVDAADQAAASGRRLLYLLDEVLRGTNSYERQVAVRRVVLHLLAKGALGAVSTHDLQLAEIEDLRPSCHPVHFRESWEDGRMTFDYKMRSGVATTTNALDLLAMVGLGLEEGEERTRL